MPQDFQNFQPTNHNFEQLKKKGVGALVLVVLSGVLLFLVAGIVKSSAYITRTYETAIVTRFGEIVGVRTDPGLGLKIPGIDTVNRVDMRVRPWDGPAAEMPTRDKLYIVVDTFARWEVADPEIFYTKFLTERRAL